MRRLIVGWFFKSNDEKRLERLGFDVALFKQAGEYEQLIRSVKKLEGEELRRSQDFIAKVNSNQLDVIQTINGLADSQVIIVFCTFQQVAQEGVGCLGPNVRAHGIIYYSNQIDKMISNLKRQKDGKQTVDKMREFLGSSFRNFMSSKIDKGVRWDMATDDMIALLGDVQFKFIVPIINV